MYIKINKRFDKLQFSVIESYRDGEKVKHRTLVYLASIPKGDLKNVHRLVMHPVNQTVAERVI